MSNDTNVKVTARGVGFIGLLTLLFIGLRLAGIIGWSWFWVLSPLFLPTLIVLLILAALFVGVFLIDIVMKFIQATKARRSGGE